MAIVTFKVFRCIGTEQRLIQTRQVQTASSKTLTGKRALALLRREYPAVGYAMSLQKTEHGWLHRRTVAALPGCAYHCEWEHIYVLEEH